MVTNISGVSPGDGGITQKIAILHYVQYPTWDGAFLYIYSRCCPPHPVVCLSSEFKNVCNDFAAFFFGGVRSSWIFFFFSPPTLPPPSPNTRVKDACFHWWPRFLLLSRLQQCIVLMGRDLYRPDACLYSTKREDLAWGRYHSSFSDGALACNGWQTQARTRFLRKKKNGLHNGNLKMQRITLKKDIQHVVFFIYIFFFAVVICLFPLLTQLWLCYMVYKHTHTKKKNGGEKCSESDARLSPLERILCKINA